MSTYLGNLNPDSTFASDIQSATRIATSAPFARYLEEEIYARSAFVKSGIIRTDSRLNGTIGPRIEAPFFNPLNSVEEVVESNDTWGTGGGGYYTSQKITASTQYATVTHRGFMYSRDEISQMNTGENALQHFSRQLPDDLNVKKSDKLFSMLGGIFTTALAANSLDKSVTTGAAEANFISAANVTEAKYLLGERARDIRKLVCHSKVAAYMEQVGMLTFSTSALSANGAVTWGGGGVSITDTQVRNFAGLEVIVDDQCPILGTTGEQEQFVCYLMGDGSVYEGNQMALRLRDAFNIPSNQYLTSVTYDHCFHIPGITWVAGTDNPNNTALSNGANWSAAYSDTRLIPVVQLIVNSPFGGLVP